MLPRLLRLLQTGRPAPHPSAAPLGSARSLPPGAAAPALEPERSAASAEEKPGRTAPGPPPPSAHWARLANPEPDWLGRLPVAARGASPFKVR